MQRVAGRLGGAWMRVWNGITQWGDAVLLAVGTGLVASLLLAAAALLLS